MTVSRRLLAGLAITALGGSLLAAPASASTEEISGYGTTRDVFCFDTVVVSGGRNVVKVTAHCNTLVVSGDDNVVRVTSPVKSVVVSGNRNSVLCDWSFAKTSDTGLGNTVKC
ncbi:DUF3060 domain-containing protein [Tsukamurella paurometabola]|uniref:DUF3060 domain-containing protein n=1 Tax=Tsukamurella paurometabola TaxID=2061 RepID=A0ABS5NB10_TSUPA|nr:DUF3060 domain-containing protein [Tsukamurella paurometabola]MBS4100837.1 DUF3060 domain-containing protein [Tsukamurella paurometabola]